MEADDDFYYSSKSVTATLIDKPGVKASFFKAVFAEKFDIPFTKNTGKIRIKVFAMTPTSASIKSSTQNDLSNIENTNTSKASEAVGDICDKTLSLQTINE